MNDHDYTFTNGGFGNYGSWANMAGPTFASSTCVTVSDASGGGGSVTFPSVFQIDNANLDYALGIIFFLISVGFIIWLFKGRK